MFLSLYVETSVFVGNLVSVAFVTGKSLSSLLKGTIYLLNETYSDLQTKILAIMQTSRQWCTVTSIHFNEDTKSIQYVP